MEKTVKGDVEQVSEKERETNRVIRLQLLWSRLIVYIICIFCVTAFVLVNAAWIFYTYFPRNCDCNIENSYQSDRIFPEVWSETRSPDKEVSIEEGPTTEDVAEDASLVFVDRDMWGAQRPREPLPSKLKLPVPYVIISHTFTDFCHQKSECIFRVRFIQTFNIESRGWSDIGYNFLVGGTGSIYVGRSWDFAGAHSFGFNNRSIGISFIGTYNSEIPSESQLDAVQKLLKLGVEIGKIAPDYKLLGHRQVSMTLSPGDALYSIIKKWPHWSPKP